MPALKKQDTDLDFSGVGKIIRALMNPVTADPGSPGIGEIWFVTNEGSGRLKIRGTSSTLTMATLDDVTAGSITSALWNAQSVVVAVADDTPVPLTLTASTLLARRATGDIGAVSFANLLTDLMALSAFNTAVDARAQTIVNATIDAAPIALNTLNELAAALNDDPNFATTITTLIGTKAGKFSGNYGNGTLTSFTVAHNLGTQDVLVGARVIATGDIPDIHADVIDANSITVNVNTVYATDALRITVIG